MKRVVLATILTFVLATAGAATYWYLSEQRLERFSKTPFGGPGAHVVDIPPGSNPKKVAALLAASGVISDGERGYAWLHREKLGPKLKAGEYQFDGPLTPSQVIEKIIRGDVKQYRFTVPEGLRLDEIVPILARSDLKLSAEKLWAFAKDKQFIRKLGVPADSLEGFLFPDTYAFPRSANEEIVIRKMVERTIDEYRKAPRAPSIELNLLQTVTLASIIEKETAAVEERPRISCVFHNRLKLRMPLATDPTVLYAMMLKTGVYSKNITREDLRSDHPYNTYKVKGLPPGPIASAGAAAIRAALNPLECDDLYFVSMNNGTHVFCPTLKCHEENVEKWQRQFFRERRANPH